MLYNSGLTQIEFVCRLASQIKETGPDVRTLRTSCVSLGLPPQDVHHIVKYTDLPGDQVVQTTDIAYLPASTST